MAFQAPTNMNAATLNKMSMTLLKMLSSVCLFISKKPSHAKEVPQENASKRSSVPRRVVRPMARMARERY